MDFLKSINNNSLLITPSNMKSTILDYINKLDTLLNVKILSFNELKKEILFDYKEEALLLLMKEYGLNKEVAEEYLNNIYYIEDKSYDNEKLNELVKMKKLLLDNNLIVTDDLLESSYKDKDIYVYGYDYIDSFNNRLLSSFNKVHIIKKEKIKDSVNIYEFNNLKDEVIYLLDSITNLIDKGISLEDIVIVNTDDNYKKEIYKLFKITGIPVEIYKNTCISSTIVGNKVLKYLNTSRSIEETFNYLNEELDLENEYDYKIYSKILSIFNKYYSYDYSFDIIYECIKDDFNKESVNLSKNIGIKIGDLSNSYYDESKYVFLVGFNEGVVPRIHKDEDYISDSLKPLVGLTPSSTLNELEKESLFNNLLSIKNLSSSYSLRYKDSELFKSSLIDEKVLITSKYELDSNLYYSDLYAKLSLSKKLDELIKYNKHDESLDSLYNKVSIDYKTYDNRYKPIDSKALKEYLDNKINLSYSTIKTFYSCQFRFYLDKILKISPYEETFEKYLGNLFHFVISKMKEDNFDLDREWNSYLNNRELTNKELFYVNKLKKELVIIIDFLKEFNYDTGLDKVYTEEKRVVKKSNGLDVTFTGYVDKIMYKEYDGVTLVSIIDYKTGNQDCDLKDAYYGIDLQLPVYLYLIDKDRLFPTYKIVGFYLQKILQKEVEIDEKKSYLDLKYDNLKLLGYSTTNLTDLSRFDPGYESSRYIRSMSITKEGKFNSKAKVLDEKEFNATIKLVDSKIDNVINSINNADFKINPIVYKDEEEKKGIKGCDYCNYKDVCFRRYRDVLRVDKKENLSFLSEYE